MNYDTILDFLQEEVNKIIKNDINNTNSNINSSSSSSSSTSKLDSKSVDDNDDDNHDNDDNDHDDSKIMTVDNEKLKESLKSKEIIYTSKYSSSLLKRTAVMLNVPDEYSFLEQIKEFRNDKYVYVTCMYEIKEYFKKILNGDQISVINNTIVFVIMTKNNTLIMKDMPSDHCTKCKSYSGRVFSVKCKECNDKYDFCTKCHKFEPEKDIICPKNKSHIMLFDHVSNVIDLSIKCDLCGQKFTEKNRGQDIMSSPEFDIDICLNCSKTEKGIEVIQKYKMEQNPILIDKLYYEFGSVFDWIPVYSAIFNDDFLTHYIAVCANSKNQYYGKIAIIKKCHNYNYEKNKEKDLYEYTIIYSDIKSFTDDIINSNYSRTNIFDTFSDMYHKVSTYSESKITEMAHITHQLSRKHVDLNQL